MGYVALIEESLNRTAAGVSIEQTAARRYLTVNSFSATGVLHPDTSKPYSASVEVTADMTCEVCSLSGQAPMP